MPSAKPPLGLGMRGWLAGWLVGWLSGWMPGQVEPGSNSLRSTLERYEKQDAILNIFWIALGWIFDRILFNLAGKFHQVGSQNRSKPVPNGLLEESSGSLGAKRAPRAKNDTKTKGWFPSDLAKT